MKGKFQTTMIFVIVSIQSYFIGSYFDQIDFEISIIALALFVVSFILFISFLGEINKKDSSESIVKKKW